MILLLIHFKAFYFKHYYMYNSTNYFYMFRNSDTGLWPVLLISIILFTVYE